jgi:carbon monoxide dehydrogenase subunit G
MPTITREITVEAPIDDVFGTLEDPSGLPRFVPGVSEVTDIHRTEDRIGDSFRVVYSVAGIKLPQKFTTIVYVRPSRAQLRFEGPMRGTMDWQLDAQGPATRVSLEIDYTVAGGPLGEAVNAVLLERMNEKNAERMLENLKLVVEAPGPAGATA